MALDFAAQLMNVQLLTQYNYLEAAANSFGELAVLVNDANVVTDTINEVLTSMQDLLEDTIILDPDIEINLCPNCEADENNGDKESDTYTVFPAYIEISPSDKLLRATLGLQEGQLDYITDWVDYDPDGENDLALAQAFKLLSETIERRYKLSKIKPTEGEV